MWDRSMWSQSLRGSAKLVCFIGLYGRLTARGHRTSIMDVDVTAQVEMVSSGSTRSGSSTRFRIATPRARANSRRKSASLAKVAEAIGDESYRVLSYNICWGCMEADTSDTTGMKHALKQHCVNRTNVAGANGPNGMGLKVTVCAKNMGQSINKYSVAIGGYDLIALQEASNAHDLNLTKFKMVEYGTPIVDKLHTVGAHKGKSKFAWIASLYDRARMGPHDLKVTGGEERKSRDARPYLVLIWDKKKLIFINLHNSQPSSPSWLNFPAEIGERLNQEAFKSDPARKNYRVILTGDFNDLKGTLRAKLKFPWNGAELVIKEPLAKSCCISMLNKDPVRPGDYIFDSASKAENRIPALYNGKLPQSDHRPVEAILAAPSRSPPAPAASPAKATAVATTPAPVPRAANNAAVKNKTEKKREKGKREASDRQQEREGRAFCIRKGRAAQTEANGRQGQNGKHASERRGWSQGHAVAPTEERSDFASNAVEGPRLGSCGR